MFPIRYRKTATWLLGAAIALILLWLALPRLLGMAAERWLAVPGVNSLRVDVVEIGADRINLGELRGTYRAQSDARLDFALTDIDIDYSAARRRVERVEVGQAALDLHAAETSTPSPWPLLVWPNDLPGDVRLRDLQIALHRPAAAPLTTRGDLEARLSSDRIAATLRTTEGWLELTATAGETIDVGAKWLPNTGPTATIQIRANRQPATQPLEIRARLPLPLAVELTRIAGFELALAQPLGEVTVDAKAVVGETSGTLRGLEGEATLADVGAQVPLTATNPEPGNALAVSLDGRLRFLWQAQQAQLELLPGLRWQLTDDKSQIDASGQLARSFTIANAHDETTGDGDFPLTVRTTPWGSWEATIHGLRIAGGPALDSFRSAQARVRVKGKIPRWRNGTFAATNVQATGETTLDWSPQQGVSGRLSAQVTPERLALSGMTPLTLMRSAWAITAQIQAPSLATFAQQLTARGEASSPQARVEFGSNAEHSVTTGPVRLQLAQLGTTRRGVAKADLSVAIDAIHWSTSWPSPDVRARILLDGDRLRSEGRLLLNREEALQFTAAHALARGCGQGSATAKQALANLGKRLQPLPPALAPLELSAGEMEAAFEFDWCATPDAKLDAKGKLDLRDAGIGWEKAYAQGVLASLRLDGWQPLRGGVQLTAPRGQLATGTELTNLDVNLALTGETLSIGALSLNLLGGSVHSAPITLPWPPTEQPLPLTIGKIDLGQLLDVFKVSGLSGSGRLDGVLPLTYRDGALEVSDGHLNSTGSGTLKYAPAQVIADNPGLQALRNLHFQKLDMRLNYASNGAYRTESILEGSNPDFYDGYPIRFSLNINGELPGLFRSALFSGDFNRHILEQLQSGKLQ